MKQLELSRSLLHFLEDNAHCSKLCRMLKNAYFTDRYRGTHYWGMLTTSKEMDYLTYRNNGLISYLPKGKEHLINDAGEWSRENRQEGKPAKVIKKIIKKSALKLFKDTDFDVFANRYKAKCDEEAVTIKILPNTSIKDIYDMDRQAGGGSLNGSCMNGDSNYLDIYHNCDKLQIIAMTDTKGLLCGRALLWNVREDVKLMDRIYCANEHQYELFLDYADTKGFWRKKNYKSYEDKDMFIDAEGNERQKHWRITLETSYNHYPYIDTFQYGGDGYITNDDNCGDSYRYCLTDGNRDGDAREWCEIDQCYYDEDECIFIERGRYSGCYIHESHAVKIGYSWYWSEDNAIVQVEGLYYEKDGGAVQYVESKDEWYMDEDVVWSDSNGEFILRDEAYCIDGEYYHEDDVDEVTCYKVKGQIFEADDVEKC